MNIAIPFSLCASMLLTGFLSGYAMAADSGASSTINILTVYPEGSSFKDLALHSNGIKCGGGRWNVEWRSNYDWKLPIDISIDSDALSAIKKTYLTLLKYQSMKDSRPDGSLLSLEILSEGCKIIIMDRI